MSATARPPIKRPRPAEHSQQGPQRTAELTRFSANQNRPLTQMQKLAIKYLAEGESVVSAALRAGYNDKGTAVYALIKRPEVRAMLDAEKAKYEEAAGMTRKKVMDGLLEAVEMAKLLAEPASMIAGWREIGKMCGYYEPVQKRVDITVNGSVVLDRMNKLSDAELLRLIQQEIRDESTELEGPGEPEESDE
jgi:phage terminase small subunit